jgi:hypothetical protein
MVFPKLFKTLFGKVLRIEVGLTNIDNLNGPNSPLWKQSN